MLWLPAKPQASVTFFLSQRALIETVASALTGEATSDKLLLHTSSTEVTGSGVAVTGASSFPASTRLSPTPPRPFNLCHSRWPDGADTLLVEGSLVLIREVGVVVVDQVSKSCDRSEVRHDSLLHVGLGRVSAAFCGSVIWSVNSGAMSW